jgi:hypothetical protein
MAIFERVVLRNGQRWSPLYIDSRCSTATWASRTLEEILHLASRIPHDWFDFYFRTLSPEDAEHKFLERHRISNGA